MLPRFGQHPSRSAIALADQTVQINGLTMLISLL
jgi:hypothetical protein